MWRERLFVLMARNAVRATDVLPAAARARRRARSAGRNLTDPRARRFTRRVEQGQRTIAACIATPSGSGWRWRARGRHVDILGRWLQRLERGDRVHDLPDGRAGRRRHVAPGIAVVDVARRDVVPQLLLPPARWHLHDRRPAELGRALRVSRRQPRRQQPVGGRARAHGRSRSDGATSWRASST